MTIEVAVTAPRRGIVDAHVHLFDAAANEQDPMFRRVAANWFQLLAAPGGEYE